MRICVKKLHCRDCRKLVRGHEQKVNSNTRVLCPRCGRLICFWDGLTWRYPVKSNKRARRS